MAVRELVKAAVLAARGVAKSATDII